MEQEYEELKKLAKPLHDWLASNFHPHMYIVINTNSVSVVEKEISVPLKKEN